MIDTQTKRRSVSGYSGLLIAPLSDGTIDAADREHVAGLYSGIGATPPIPPIVTLDDIFDIYYYDRLGAIGTVTGGTIMPPETIYDV